MEQLIVLKAYKTFHGNKAATARSLGISIKTLYNKFYEWGNEITGEDFGEYVETDETSQNAPELVKTEVPIQAKKRVK